MHNEPRWLGFTWTPTRRGHVILSVRWLIRSGTQCRFQQLNRDAHAALGVSHAIQSLQLHNRLLIGSTQTNCNHSPHAESTTVCGSPNHITDRPTFCHRSTCKPASEQAGQREWRLVASSKGGSTMPPPRYLSRSKHCPTRQHQSAFCFQLLNGHCFQRGFAVVSPRGKHHCR